MNYNFLSRKKCSSRNCFNLNSKKYLFKDAAIPVISLYFLVFTCLQGCKKFVEVDPPKTQITKDLVFTTDATATSAIEGLYEQMMENIESIANGGLTLYTGLSSDELVYYMTTPSYGEFYSNGLEPTNENLKSNLWGPSYNYIYQANSIIEGLSKSTTVSVTLKQQLIGEAKFIRAFYYFYLTNLWGDVPLIISTDYLINSKAGRIQQNEIYDQIIADLTDAKSLLSSDYSFSNGERIRPTQWAAIALLARVYLYIGDWTNAEAQSSLLINNTNFFSLADLNDVFLKNSNEAIWQLLPVVPDVNTGEGYMFAQTDGIPTYAGVSDNLLAVFEAGDNRKTSWIYSYSSDNQNYNVPFKYKLQFSPSQDEYNTVLRLAEQYLIRAEARAEQNNILGAQSDLNTIRNRAGLSNTLAGNKEELLLAIGHERQVELFAEWGHRWLDLKRTHQADIILGPLKRANWQSTDSLYPIPQYEIDNDPNLTQNAGY